MGEAHTNRLADESSPYLVQHAHNPVDWYPWGPEALEKARAEDRPILLSIGYSACHWCHVMERESFEDYAIAAQMNASFVCIKVDREERPDLDHVYQMVVQLMGRSGGWPLTVFLTPDQRPFFGGTYFPPEDRHGMPGLPRVLEAIADAYQNKRSDVELQGQELTQAIGRVSDLAQRTTEQGALGQDLLEKTSRKLSSRYDEKHGGFGERPNFPNSMCLEVLLRRGVEERDAEAARRARLALDRMRQGGIWDHLGGGFHRYSTDERWLVPHFEKMLYDNALLLRLYADSATAFDDDLHAETASDIGTWLLGEMQSPAGGFYATQDADSEGHEGKFFVFTPREIDEVLGDDSLARDAAKRYFGVTDAGNFEATGATVLAENRPLARVADELAQPQVEVQAALARATRRLLSFRRTRVAPFRDEKILASWNGLTIGALAAASLSLGEPSLLAAAQKAFDHLSAVLMVGGRVGRSFKDGQVKSQGFLDDHAFVCWAALELYDATGDPSLVTTARAIADEIVAHFWDEGGRGFFFTPSDGEKLICRSKDAFDQAIPSGSSMAALSWLKLGALVDEKYTALAARYLEGVAPAAIDNPFAFGQTICVLDRLVRGSTDVVLVGRRNDPLTAQLRAAAYGVYVPNRNVVTLNPDDRASYEAAPLLAEGKAAGPRPQAFVCRDRACSAPVTEASELALLLRT